MSKVKGLRQKTANGYTDFIPFGTDSILVDMANGLDLEQELKIGGTHTSEIVEKIDEDTGKLQTIITEEFGSSGYYNTTTITENENSTSIVIELMAPNGTKKLKTITIPASSTIDPETEIESLTIQEVLS